MAVRRQDQPGKDETQPSQGPSGSSDGSVEERIRRAIQQARESSRPRLTWDEVFAFKVEPNSATTDAWVHDTLLDAEFDEELDRELDELEQKRAK